MTNEPTPEEKLILERMSRGIKLGEHGLWKIYDRKALEKLPEPKWIVGKGPRGGGANILTDGLTIFYGASQAGKTTLASEIACFMAAGQKSWHGCTLQTGPVLYYATEAVRGMLPRIVAAEKWHDLDVSQLLVVDAEKLEMNNPAHVEAMRQDILAVKPVMVFIDTLTNALGPGRTENDAGDMAAFFKDVNGVVEGLEERPGIGIVHHSGNDPTRLRGSSAMKARVDTLIRVEDIGDAGEGDAMIRVSCEKQREGERFKPWRVTRTAAHGGVVLSWTSQTFNKEQ